MTPTARAAYVGLLDPTTGAVLRSQLAVPRVATGPELPEGTPPQSAEALTEAGSLVADSSGRVLLFAQAASPGYNHAYQRLNGLPPRPSPAVAPMALWLPGDLESRLAWFTTLAGDGERTAASASAGAARRGRMVAWLTQVAQPPAASSEPDDEPLCPVLAGAPYAPEHVQGRSLQAHVYLHLLDTSAKGGPGLE